MYGSAGRADCFSPRKALWCARRHILPPCGYADSPKGCRGRAESPLLASINDNFAVSNSPWRGLTRRYRREGRACSPMGRSIVRVAIRRGLGRAESPQCARRRNPQPPVGIDAPTPARVVGLPPRGGQYFLSKRKKVPKKACGTATPEAARPAARRGLRPAGARRAVLCLGSLCSPAGKKPLIAHFDGGARNVARNEVGQLSLLLERARARLFPPSKWAGLFPSAAYRRSSPPPLGWGRRSNNAGWATCALVAAFARLKVKEFHNYAGL